MKPTWIGLLIIVFAGCHGATRDDKAVAADCWALIEDMGFRKLPEMPCPEKVCKWAGMGGIRDGAWYALEGDLPILMVRAYSSREREYGHYWSLPRQGTTQSDYRTRYSICPEWNDLSELVRCPLKKFSRVVIGPGQSAACVDRTRLAATPALQIWVRDTLTDIDMDKCQKIDWADYERPPIDPAKAICY
jgi:hypothetical protein